jgi:hypothetical protein
MSANPVSSPRHHRHHCFPLTGVGVLHAETTRYHEIMTIRHEIDHDMRLPLVSMMQAGCR